MSSPFLKEGDKEFENVQKMVSEKLHLERRNFKKEEGSIERESLENHDFNQVLFKAFTMTNLKNFSNYGGS